MKKVIMLKNLLLKKKELQKLIADVETKIAMHQQKAIAELESLGGSTAHQGFYIGIRTEVWMLPAVDDRSAAVEALKAAGLGDYVAELFYTSQVSAYAREQIRENPDWSPPEHFRLDRRKSITLKQLNYGA